MKINGQFRDVITGPNGEVTDKGWLSNTIVKDYGRFLAALMKRDFTAVTGIDYIAVGNIKQDYETFKTKIIAFFTEGKLDKPLWFNDEQWVWAKKIQPGEMRYLKENGGESLPATDTLQIDIVFGENEPQDTLIFKEFSLLGADDKKTGGLPDTSKMFFINYVTHGPITKDKRMVLTRTVKLTFPIN
jgi:hypothetical protein